MHLKFCGRQMYMAPQESHTSDITEFISSSLVALGSVLELPCGGGELLDAGLLLLPGAPARAHDALHLEEVVGQEAGGQLRDDAAQAALLRLLLLVQARHQRVHLLLRQQRRRSQQLVLAHRQVPAKKNALLHSVWFRWER